MPELGEATMQTVLDFLNTPLLLAILGYLIYMARKLGELSTRVKHLEDIHGSTNPDEGGSDATDTNPARYRRRHTDQLIGVGNRQAVEP